MSDAPIDPQDYGVKVVQIDDLRVARGLTRRPTFTNVGGTRTRRSNHDFRFRQ